MATALHALPSPTVVIPWRKSLIPRVTFPSGRWATRTVSCDLMIPPARRNRSVRLPPPMASVSGSPTSADSVSTENFVRFLGGVEIFDLEGRSVPLTDLWKDRKVVIGFARHFGCIFCRKRADLLVSKKEAMDAAGVALAIIGPGTVEQAKAFSEQTKFKGEVYADPGHVSFDALNLVSGVTTTFTPSSGLKLIQVYMEGYRQDWGLSLKKDTVARGGWQQGGILVAGPGKDNISYFHKDKEAGDDPDMEDVIIACCS